MQSGKVCNTQLGILLDTYQELCVDRVNWLMRPSRLDAMFAGQCSVRLSLNESCCSLHMRSARRVQR